MSDNQLMAQLATLRESLRSADIEISGSLSKVFHAFLDITEGPDLMRACKQAESEIIRETLERVARQFTRDEAVSLQGLRMLSHAPTGFFHGGFFAGRAMGTFLYFAEEGQGLVAFSQGTPMTHFFRITSTELPPGTVPMRRPPGIQ